MFANSPLGPRIAEARRQDDVVRAAAYRTTARLRPAAIAYATGSPSIRYRVGAAMVSVGQRLSGVELRRRPLDDGAASALPGVR